MNKPVKVPVVEDSGGDAELVLRAFRQGGFDPTHRRAQNAVELESALTQERWDAVISDFKMPGFTALDALKICRSAGLDIPFILASGTIGEETAVDAMRAGASDDVMKTSLARLAPALERELKEAAMRVEHRRATEEPMVGKDGHPEYLLGMSEDITERKRAQQSMQERVRTAALGAEVGAALTRGKSLEDMLRLCCEAIVRNLHAAFARIWTVVPAQQFAKLLGTGRAEPSVVV
jgi:DNA-binding NtrC family response regulator